MRRALFAAAASILAIAATAPPAYAETRIALVIGNSSYRVGPLKNPANDAKLMAGTLKGLGFEVIALLDANQKAMKKAMVAFGRRLRVSDSVGLFYYAGHGVQVRGENYLVPIGADIQDEAEVAVEGVSVNDFLQTMERSSSRINIAVFDACRNNPFARSFRSGTRGLARVDAPTGTLIAYATAPGQVAHDGKAGNSPYTAALAKAMTRPGLTIEEVFKRARVRVLSQTQRRQTPWETSSLTGDFYFKRAISVQGKGTAPSGGRESGRLAELSFWDSVKDSGDPAMLKAYLKRFPDGLFADLAELKLRRAGNGSKVAALPPAATAPSTGRPAGNPEDLFRQGLAHDSGDGVALDKSKAARLYRAAADAGHAGAMTNLGVLYETGRGVKRDYARARRLYRAAADAGSAGALNNLGVLNQSGHGVPRNIEKALSFYRQAADLGYLAAMHNIAQLYDGGRGVDHSDTEAARWYRMAAEKGHAASMAVLGTMYERGEGVARNPGEAFRWYQRAAAKGDALGMTRLGHMYSLGKAVRRNDADAVQWYRKAAEKGMTQAMYNLGVLYELGRGLPRDAREAARWYRQAADENFAAAKRALAVLHDEGTGVQRDPVLAAELLLQAYRQGHQRARDDLLRKFGTWSVGTRKEIQRQLKAAGVYSGPLTGRFDGATRKAITAYRHR